MGRMKWFYLKMENFARKDSFKEQREASQNSKYCASCVTQGYVPGAVDWSFSVLPSLSQQQMSSVVSKTRIFQLLFYATLNEHVQSQF
jgi:hypothetical protein